MSFDHDPPTDETVPNPPEEAEEGTEIASVELEEVLRRRPTRGQRAVRIGALAAVVLVGATLVLHAAGVRIPRPQRPVSHRQIGVALVSNISFGTLTLNGRRLSGPLPQAVTLRDGTNVIVLTAPPFQPRQCRVTWPDLSLLGGRCSVGVAFLPALNSALEIEYQIALDFDSRDLPPAAAAAARAAVNAAIGATHYDTAVPTGQPIATGWTPRTGAIQRLPAPSGTRARLSFTAVSTPACPAGLCTGPDFTPGFAGQQLPSGPAWMVTTSITYTWRFVTRDGTLLGSVTYPTDAPVSFSIVPDGDSGASWRLWQPTPSASTKVMQDALNLSVCDWASVFRVALPGVPSPAGVGTQIGAGIAGCAFALQTATGAQAGTLIWRFGVLLAADDKGHTGYPTLPLAPAGERQAIGA